MAKLDRSDIEWIGQHSNWSEKGISQALREHVHADGGAWEKFLSRSFLGLGTAFSLAGIFFFFAYNWDSLHRFVKLGLLEGLLVLLVLGLLALRPRPLATKALLTAAALLVGALYGVYGQIYQRGADAYELFLVWALMILPWVLVAHFAPLWLVWITLANLSLLRFAEQGGIPWVSTEIATLLFLLNGIFLVAFRALPYMLPPAPLPSWFHKLLAIYTLLVALFYLPLQIVDAPLERYWPLFLVVLLFLSLGLWHGLRTKRSFYLAIGCFGAIVLVSALLLRISNGGGMLLLIGLFIVCSIGLLVKTLIDLQRKWIH